MKHFLIALALTTLVSSSVLGQALPDGHPMSIWSEDETIVSFWASDAWLFNTDSKRPHWALSIEDIEPLNGAPALTAESFDADTFDPRNYAIRLNTDKPLYIKVGDRGTLFFYSVNRTEILYERSRINDAATIKKENK